jgi:hypothetical protein
MFARVFTFAVRMARPPFLVRSRAQQMPTEISSAWRNSAPERLKSRCKYTVNTMRNLLVYEYSP